MVSKDFIKQILILYNIKQNILLHIKNYATFYKRKTLDLSIKIKTNEMF